MKEKQAFSVFLDNYNSFIHSIFFFFDIAIFNRISFFLHYKPFNRYSVKGLTDYQ